MNKIRLYQKWWEFLEVAIVCMLNPYNEALYVTDTINLEYDCYYGSTIMHTEALISAVKLTGAKPWI